VGASECRGKPPNAIRAKGVEKDEEEEEEEEDVMKLLIMQSSPTSCHLLPLKSKYSPQNPVLTLTLYS
jgi:hypothetical protein